MPVASVTARTEFTLWASYSRRHGAFSGKTAAAAIDGDEVTTVNAYFARAATGLDAMFARAVTEKSSYYARAVTAEDSER
jgi:hypothetical protein